MTAISSARAILIAGPTASGKSGFALRLAEELGGVVINADSMQVYRELAILTARPPPSELARASHALYGFVSGAEPYSAGRYAADAAHAIDEARSRGRIPIIVGGTGLYFKVLLEGLSPVPAADPAVRAYWRAQAATRPATELHAILAQRDPVTAARLMPTDPQRIVRALEVLESTGRSLADWQREPGKPVLAESETVRLLAVAGAHAAGGAIDARFDAMMKAGALEEVRTSWLSASPRSCRSCAPSEWLHSPRTWPGASRWMQPWGGQDGDPAIRQAAADLAEEKYDVVETPEFATNGKHLWHHDISFSDS